MKALIYKKPLIYLVVVFPLFGVVTSLLAIKFHKHRFTTNPYEVTLSIDTEIRLAKSMRIVGYDDTSLVFIKELEEKKKQIDFKVFLFTALSAFSFTACIVIVLHGSGFSKKTKILALSSLLIIPVLIISLTAGAAEKFSISLKYSKRKELSSIDEGRYG